MSNVYIYVVDRDFGFAPNPFHGICSLATCKPKIRSSAQVGDWIFGVGGSRLKATGQCIFAMKVTRKITFNEYWIGAEFRDKKSIRNGSKKMLLGDNIYYYDEKTEIWNQAHSHHSLPNGNVNEYNRDRDTKSRNVLISKHFYYFGRAAPKIPVCILNQLGYQNRMGHRKFTFENASLLVNWIDEEFADMLNLVVADPYDFDQSDAHYSVKTNRIT
ncbi:MAG: hypothetical protein EOP48_15605 [Sphingobacteriales bacterium]|nr:MAG: hypothetical protein EOP48_15605 [Sphingobacteriales bacterium]